MSNGMRSILVVDRDSESAGELSKVLTETGLLVKTSDDAAHARSILQHRLFDVLIIDVVNARSDDTNLIRWVGKLWPRPRIVATEPHVTTSETVDTFYAMADMFLEKPIQVRKRLSWLSTCSRKTSFAGTVDEVDIIEHIQYVMLSRRDTVIEIVSKSGTRGLLFLRRGDVAHSSCGVLRGEEALFRCLCFDGGTFRHLPWTEPEKVTINKAGTFLLIEAARRRDEEFCTENTSGREPLDQGR